MMNELPSDIIFCIADLLDTRTVWNVLRLVCKRLHNLFNHSIYWKHRLRKNSVILPVRYFNCESARFANFACSFEDESRNLRNLNEPCFTQVHYGDAIRLISNGSRCVTGSRNSSLSFWNLTIGGSIEKIQELKQAHLGWIWSLEEQSNGVVLSAGFDNFLKKWDLLNGDVKMVDEICLGSPVLWSRSTENTVLVGTCNSKISVLDRRDWTTQICTLTYPRQPAIDAVVPKDTPYFYSLSEDGVSCVDSRMWAKFKEFRWKNSCHAIAKSHEILYVARSVNERQDTCIQLIDIKTLSFLNDITFFGAPRCRLSATDSTFACLAENLTIYSGGIQPTKLWQYNDGMSEFINLDYANGRIALTSTDGKLSCFY